MSARGVAPGLGEPLVRGRCPGALRPMLSGDGLVVRVRPRLARLSAAQAIGLARLAQRHGSGIIELTNRANLQIRGVSPEAHGALIDGLGALDLVDADPRAEARRNILLTPFWEEGDLSARLARRVEERLADLPAMPGKIGFAIDTGAEPLLMRDPADFRLERSAEGLILRADGAARGWALGEEDVGAALVEMAAWFARHRSHERRRMAQVVAAHDLPPAWETHPPRPPDAAPEPGRHASGALVGVAFGALDAEALLSLLEKSAARALRVTPWRMLLLEGARDLPGAPFITDARDPLLRVDACPGAPFCVQATVETRALARRLAPLVHGSLHVSGCAKGCARRRAARVMLTGRAGRYDLAFEARAWDAPRHAGLDPEDILARTDL